MLSDERQLLGRGGANYAIDRVLVRPPTTPTCSGGARRECMFGGTVQASYGKGYSQQFIYASSERRSLEGGIGCVGDTDNDAVGATFKQVFDGAYYVIWNDQFYQDPIINGCWNSCGRPWGHSKGVLSWNESGNGFVMQVTTPNWPGAGNALRLPWQNAYAERLIGSIRRECLDHMVVFGEAHLRRILGAYAAYYNASTTHHP